MAANDFTPVAADALGLDKMVAQVLSDAPGISITPGSASFNGSTSAVSTFDSVNFGNGIALGRGLLLTSGDGTPALSNTSGSYGQDNGAAGDADLTAAAKAAFPNAGETRDASIFSFAFTAAQAGTVKFSLLFGSDEYPEFSNTDFVDIAAVFINGTNYAYFHGDASEPLSIIEKNLAGNFNNNEASQASPFSIEYDGISSVLTVAAPVVAGTNSIKFAVGDTGDGIYDSGLFISGLSFSSSSATGIKLLKVPTTDPDGPNLMTTTGDNLAEEFHAGAGNDTIAAGGGDDLIDAGDGGDQMTGGLGDDELNGGNGVDVAVYSGGPTLYTLKLVGGVLTVSSALEGSDKLISVETIQTAGGSVPLDAAFSSLFKFTNTMSGEASFLLGTAYTGPVAYTQKEILGTANGEAVGGTTANDFVNGLAGDDAINGNAGDDVIDGGLGSNFLTGGADRDVYFLDGRGGVTTWSTITDWAAGEELSVWGYKPGVSKLLWVASDGTEGFKGLTMHGDLNGDGVIETSITWAGQSSQSQLPVPKELDGLLWFV